MDVIHSERKQRSVGLADAAAATVGTRERRLPVETGWRLWRLQGKQKWWYGLASIRIVEELLLGVRMLGLTWMMIVNFFYDFVRFWRYSNVKFTGGDRARAGALVSMACHGLEKGLSLPKPRPGFGRELAGALLWRTKRYMETFGHDHLSHWAVQTLSAYCQFQRSTGEPVEEYERELDVLGPSLSSIRPDKSREPDDKPEAGARTLDRQHVQQPWGWNPEAFFTSRHSVREFAPQDVDMNLVERAVRLAQCSPSACNRQSAHVWTVTERERIRGVLEIQGGARGFSEGIPLILVVTSDLGCWQSVGERYQGWIDGALFAMTLVWALHALGLVSCMLNWSKRWQTDRHLRRYLGIPGNHLVVVLIAAGYPPESFKVAASPRLPLGSILHKQA